MRTRRSTTGMALVSVVFALVLTTREARSQAELRFVDEADKWGVSFVGVAGAPPRDDLSKVNGSGIAVGDVDGDGRMDLYFVQGADPTASSTPRNRLYLNRGDRFEELGGSWGVDHPGRGAGAVIVDLNGDRYPELLLTNFGRDEAFINKDGEYFVPMRGFDDDGMGMGISVGDYNGDGWGDAYVARYVVWPEVVPTQGGPCQWKGLPVICGPEAYRPQTDLFYWGTPDGGLELAETPSVFAPGRGMGACVLDANGDLQPDIYIANDASDNFLFLNTDGVLTEGGLACGVALSADGQAQAGMGIAAGDVNRDGREDLLVTNFDGQSDALYLQRTGWFEESSTMYGLASATLRRLSWGALFEDFDNDGDLDLHVANGHLYDNADEIGDGTNWRQFDDLFLNDGTTFRPVPGWDGVPAESGRGSASVDLNDDGLMDIVVWNLGGPARVMINRSESTGQWLKVQLMGGLEAALVGTRVELVACGERQVRWFRRGGSYLSSSDPRLHFGLGDCGNVESLVIRTPDGQRKAWSNLGVGKVYHLSPYDTQFRRPWQAGPE